MFFKKRSACVAEEYSFYFIRVGTRPRSVINGCRAIQGAPARLLGEQVPVIEFELRLQCLMSESWRLELSKSMKNSFQRPQL